MIYIAPKSRGESGRITGTLERLWTDAGPDAISDSYSDSWTQVRVQTAAAAQPANRQNNTRNFGKHAITPAGPSVWNALQLPKDIRASADFKKRSSKLIILVQPLMSANFCFYWFTECICIQNVVSALEII